MDQIEIEKRCVYEKKPNDCTKIAFERKEGLDSHFLNELEKN